MTLEEAEKQFTPEHRTAINTVGEFVTSVGSRLEDKALLVQNC